MSGGFKDLVQGYTVEAWRKRAREGGKRVFPHVKVKRVLRGSYFG